MRKEELIGVDEFWSLWQIAAKRASENVNLNKSYWLLMVQNFTEWFHLKHLNLSQGDIKEFGYYDVIKQVLKHIKTADVVESLVYTAANFAFDLEQALKVDAYNYALDLYKKYSQDPESLKRVVIERYENNSAKYAQSILNTVPDELIAIRLMAIKNSYPKLPKDEKQYIKKALTIELDDSMVFDIKDLYQSHIKELREQTNG